MDGSQSGHALFDVTAGGSALLWQHLFWMFGHPWVYAIVLPAMGMVSDGLPVFCRRPLVGYTVVALATVATVVLGVRRVGAPHVRHRIAGHIAEFLLCGLHHHRPSQRGRRVRLAGDDLDRQAGLHARHSCSSPSFIILFTIGGVSSGFMTGSVPVDWQLTDTYFVVAHLHYVLIGINVFPVVGATYFWFPKMTGKLMDERLGKWNFWILFAGFNIGFFPMHISGLMGMPRRIYTYSEGMGWDWLNLITTLGSVMFAAGVLIFVWNVIQSMKNGPPAGDNPWDAPTLEWATSSPPPPYNFTVIPTVASRHPLWEDRLPAGDANERSYTSAGLVLDHGREALGTTPLDAEPNVILKMPGDTLVPLCLALAMTLLTLGLALLNWWVVAVGVGCIAASILAWLWPEAALGETAELRHE